MKPRFDLRCYAVLDPARCRGRDPVSLAESAARGGATLVQLRDKESCTRDLVELARRIHRALQPHGVPLLVNDRVDVALAAAAEGVHVGRRDMAPTDARKLLGPERILGVTVHHRHEADEVDAAIADYAGMGPVFATQSKVAEDAAIGPEGLSSLIAHTRARLPGFPICGIAGVDHQNAPSVILAGANGVAVISDIFMAEDVEFCDTASASRGGSGVGRRDGDGVTATALTIAGSDSGGGAGIQADLKTFAALGTYGCSVVTALTAQNTVGVQGIFPVGPDFVSAQMDSVFSDISIDAVKIGMLGTPALIAAVAEGLRRWKPRWVVLDPVMVAKSGDTLLADDAVTALKEELLPLASLVTPNLPEAAVLLGEKPVRERRAMPAVAARLQHLGVPNVLVKGGHLEGAGSPDLLMHGGEVIWMEGRRIQTRHTHGTGCTLSAAIAALLARKRPLPAAVHEAKAYLLEAIAQADGLGIGKGHGPVHHFHHLWPFLEASR